jgi:U3 small nucleolar RNA-associated protein 6
MANSGDRARFFLEQSVPELQQLLRKEIFSKVGAASYPSIPHANEKQDEISSVAKKRSDFEHMLSARGSQVSDYVRYLAYEQNLESLKRKRMQRLGVKNTGYHGPRRTFFIYERATRKFPGDIPLWIQYLDYAWNQKAHKRVGKILTTVLRLHPTNAELWIFAAKYAAERDDNPSAARGYFQRALRFCPKEKRIWIEYVRLEMMFISKIAKNLEDMGISSSESGSLAISQSQAMEGNTTDMIELPDDSEQIPMESLDTQALRHIATTPALSGDIPIAIFDAVMKEFDGDALLAEQIFDVIASFFQLTCTQRILKHIVQCLSRQVPATPSGAICAFKLPLVGIEPTSHKFPLALRHGLQLIRASIVQQQQNRDKRLLIAEKAAYIILPFAINKDIDDEIQTVIGSVLSQIVKILGSPEHVLNVVNFLQTKDRLIEADRLLRNSLQQFATSKRLQRKFLEFHPKARKTNGGSKLSRQSKS